MAELTDHELLADFTRTGAESAFATLVHRHINLVYSTARRFTGDDTLAADITQAVFILLARKAGGIPSRVVLTGWLYQTARLTAANVLKQKIRRQNREQEAFMQSTLTQSETDDVWRQIAPMLDDAMGALREADRNAVLLRFFEDKPLAEVGAALGVSEDAARVRVNRALDQLRYLLTKKGVTLGVTAIAGAVTVNAVTAAPVALVSTITTAALTGTTLTLATVAMTTFQKIAVTAALTVTIGAGIFEAKQAYDARSEADRLQAQQTPMQEQIQQLQNDLASSSNMITRLKNGFAGNRGDDSELLKLRGQVGVLKQQAEDAGQKLAELKSAKVQFDKKENAKVYTTKDISLCMRLFASDNHGLFPTNYLQLTNLFGGEEQMAKQGVWDNDLINIGMDGTVPGLSATNTDAPEHPDLVVLRERLAHQAPDGSWQRIYGFVDGSVVTATSYDGDFAAWEKANTYMPLPSNQ